MLLTDVPTNSKNLLGLLSGKSKENKSGLNSFPKMQFFPQRSFELPVLRLTVKLQKFCVRFIVYSKINQIKQMEDSL